MAQSLGVLALQRQRPEKVLTQSWPLVQYVLTVNNFNDLLIFNDCCINAILALGTVCTLINLNDLLIFNDCCVI